MRARFFVSGLALAVVMTAAAAANAAEVDLSTVVNTDLNTYTNGSMYPASGGPLAVGGVGFNLATFGGGTGIIQLNEGSVVIPVNQAGVATVYTLINSAYGAAGTNIGELDFVGSANTFVYTLTEGLNVRDHFNGSFVNTAPDLAASAYFGDGSVRLDEQKIVLPTNLGTLQSITFVGYGAGGGGEPFLAAVTTASVPEPATWAFMLIGFGGLGAAMRSKRRKQTAIAA